MTVVRTMTTRQRWSVVISILFVLLGLYELRRDTWLGVARIAVGVVAAAGILWEVRKARR